MSYLGLPGRHNGTMYSIHPSFLSAAVILSIKCVISLLTRFLFHPCLLLPPLILTPQVENDYTHLANLDSIQSGLSAFRHTIAKPCCRPIRTTYKRLPLVEVSPNSLACNCKFLVLLNNGYPFESLPG